MGTIQFRNNAGLRQALRTLEKFSHLWVLFVFHEHGAKTWKPMIRPPRLGGAKRVGVFASRSPHRPNPIGMSVVKILDIRPDARGGAQIDIEGVDLLDGTPVLDIKPYVPYCDSVPEAAASWATHPKVERVELKYTPLARENISIISETLTNFPALVDELMSLDPRPAFQKKYPPGNLYGFRILDWDIKFTAHKGHLLIEDVVPLLPTQTPQSNSKK